MFLQESKEFLRRMNPHAKSVSSHEVPLIVSDDGFAACCNRQLQDHVVFCVRKAGPPQEEDALPMSNLADIIQEAVDVLLRKESHAYLSRKRILVFKEQRYRNGRLKSPLLQEDCKPERSSLARTKRRDDHACI